MKVYHDAPIGFRAAALLACALACDGAAAAAWPRAGEVGRCVEFEPYPGYVTCLLDRPQADASGAAPPAALRRSGPAAPRRVDHRPAIESGCPPVHDQGPCGWCVAHATTAAIEALQCRAGAGAVGVGVSEPHLWYVGRDGDWSSPLCSGGWSITPALWQAREHALVPSALWPYPTLAGLNAAEAEPLLAEMPDARALEREGRFRTEGYELVPPADVDALRAALAAGGDVVYGVPVHRSSSWEQDRHPRIDVPVCADPDQAPCLRGHHAVLVLGYDDDDQTFEFRNSWGAGWGDSGYGRLTYAFVARWGEGGGWPTALAGMPNPDGGPSSAPGPTATCDVLDEPGHAHGYGICHCIANRCAVGTPCFNEASSRMSLADDLLTPEGDTQCREMLDRCDACGVETDPVTVRCTQACAHECECGVQICVSAGSDVEDGCVRSCVKYAGNPWSQAQDDCSRTLSCQDLLRGCCLLTDNNRVNCWQP